MLWLWCWLAAAAPIQSLAQKLPYAIGTAIKRKKKFIPLTYTEMFYQGALEVFYFHVQEYPALLSYPAVQIQSVPQMYLFHGAFRILKALITP